MNPAEALLYFTLEVTKASKELGIREPVGVVEMNFDTALTKFSLRDRRRTAAFVQSCVPNFECDYIIVILSDQLSFPKKQWLQCLARHEATHIALGHLYGTKNVAEDYVQHDMVNRVMKFRWGQPATCEGTW